MKPEIIQLTQLDDIYKAILSFNTDIVPSFSDRGLDLKEYAQKLFEFAMVYTLWHDNQACGFVTFYANDKIRETAYLAQIVVKSQVINRGFGYALLTLAMEKSIEKGMKTMKLEVYNKNHTAIAFYKRQGFTVCSDVSGAFCHMQKDLQEESKMFKWEKLGQLVNISKINHVDYMDEFTQAPCVLKFDDFIRVYFSCRLKPDANGMYISRESYLELNRKNLFEVLRVSDKPVIELGGIGEFDEFGTYPMGVVPYDGVHYGFYGGWTRCEAVSFNVSLGLAISRDGGHTFQKVGKGPVLTYTHDEPFIIASPKVRRFNDMWYLFYAAGRKWLTMEDGKVESLYKIRLAVSEDGVNWTRTHKDLIEDKYGVDESQATADVIFRNGKYHMFYCYRQGTDYRRNKDRSYRIGYASSTDLINWKREDSKVGIDVSPEGWDSEMVAHPHVFELDGEIYMFYLGNQVGKYGFGIAKLIGDLV